MGVTKCVSCKNYIDEGEVVMVPVDETHDVPYCVSCAPEEDFNSDYDDYEDQ